MVTRARKVSPPEKPKKPERKPVTFDFLPEVSKETIDDVVREVYRTGVSQRELSALLKDKLPALAQYKIQGAFDGLALLNRQDVLVLLEVMSRSIEQTMIALGRSGKVLVR